MEENVKETNNKKKVEFCFRQKKENLIRSTRLKRFKKEMKKEEKSEKTRVNTREVRQFKFNEKETHKRMGSSTLVSSL